ncbi:hypothetical protein L596_030903 [Steinernema carpocapsae]|uniref:Uncharacterized protein n=1 Tax=Steinernema carpocapsae TaxID=34508 RepID=A0A4U5MH94_STECR|nr:hypothetical protein L596_030903 [Steinernema carpocapsae]
MSRATSGRHSVLTRKVNRMVAFKATLREEMKEIMEGATPEQEATSPNNAERLATTERLLKTLKLKLPRSEN